jgi:hypothetical protein
MQAVDAVQTPKAPRSRRANARTSEHEVRAPLGLRPGEWVEVRSEAEIIATLDEHGTLDALPFMPEMRQFCGRRFRVRARADRTSMAKLWMRAMDHAVHLEDLRCDGAAHGGCSRGCAIFWKEAWLTRADTQDAVPVRRMVRPLELRVIEGERYVCQATELGRATRHLPRSEVRRHLASLTSEGVRPLDLGRAVAIQLYDFVAWRFDRPDWNTIGGPCTQTPTVSLNLQPGERVRVKSKQEIIATLDRRGWNRKMEFAREMLQFCGAEYTVLRRVERYIGDDSGRMVFMKNTVILDGLVYKDLVRLACPRREYLFWRECWLERVGG